MIQNSFNRHASEHGHEKAPLSGRFLENPPCRLPLRADFPDLMMISNRKKCLKTIERELEKCGRSLRDVGRIVIAYPHKHPDRKHHNTAAALVENMTGLLRHKSKGVDWVVAEALYDQIHLDRSGDQSSAHALLNRQDYAVDMGLQKKPLRFFDADYNPDQDGPEFFIIADKFVEQGTTIANMYSYITHNGGTVLGTICYSSLSSNLVQQKSVCPRLKDETKNTGRIPDLAESFYQSARRFSALDLTPDICADLFEEGLNRHGNSLKALTNSECTKLMYSMLGKDEDMWVFAAALRDMKIDVPESARMKASAGTPVSGPASVKF